MDESANSKEGIEKMKVVRMRGETSRDEKRRMKEKRHNKRIKRGLEKEDERDMERGNKKEKNHGE